jgi:Fe-S oxidoreductase
LEKESLSIWWDKSKPKKDNRSHSTTVWVIADIFTQYYDVNIGKDVISFLKMCNVNINVIFPKNSIVAMISHGLLNEAKNALKLLHSELNNTTKNDLIVGIEPSEVLVWRDEAKNLISGKLPDVLLFEELLLKLNQLIALPKFNTVNSKVWVYEHCHQKALAETNNLTKVLELIPGLQIDIIHGGCCGMAGDFGYKHSKISENIAHNSLDSHIEKIKDQDVLIATGVSCRKQILDIFKLQSKHLVHLFNQSVKNKC